MIRRRAGQQRRKTFETRWGEAGKLGGHCGAKWADKQVGRSDAHRRRILRKVSLRRGHSRTKWGRRFFWTCADRRSHAREQRREAAELARDNADRTITIELPREFMELCRGDDVMPMTVLRGFIADLCEITSWASDPREDGYSSNGSDERMMAGEYYDRCGYSWDRKS